MYIEELKKLLKDNMSIEVKDRYDGAAMRNGHKIQINFGNEEIASFYLWTETNAGITDVSSDFFDEEGQAARYDEKVCPHFTTSPTYDSGCSNLHDCEHKGCTDDGVPCCTTEGVL